MATKNFLCSIGLHSWGRATYIDYSIHSNTQDWKQKCERCGKIERWVQAKDIDTRYYPSITKRMNWLHWLLITLFFLMLIYLYVIWQRVK